jgi:hypothetical protein
MMLELLLSAVISTDRRNTLVSPFRWCFKWN